MQSYKDVISATRDEDWAEEFSVTHADEDVMVFSALASAGDAIETIELMGFMSEHGYELWCVVPDAREFQFRRTA